MKRSADGSSRSKHSCFYRQDASFSSSSTSQLELMTYLGLVNPKPVKPKLKECFVSIETSKCMICKRLFKCKTDTMKHIEKKHAYLLRKTDNKLVRVVMKLGKKKFYDKKIDSKYFVAPDPEFTEIKKSEEIKSPKSETFDQKPLEVSPTPVHKTLPMNISNGFIDKGSVSLFSALCDMKSLTDNASYKNGRICKGEGRDFAKRVDLEKEESVLLPGAFGSCNGQSSPASSMSDSETILYVSDIEMDLGDDYEVIYTNIPRIKEEDDVDDGEIVVLKEVVRNDFDSVRRRLKVASGAEVDSDLGVIMQAKGHVKLEPKMEPMETEPSAHAAVAPVTVAQVMLYPDIIDLDEDVISDAETEILGGDLDESRDVDDDIADLLATLEDDDTQSAFDLEAEKTRDLVQTTSELPVEKTCDLAQNNYVLPAEESFNITVDEDRPAPAVQEEIITIDDDEPVDVEELVPQSDLTSKLKDWLLAYAKETELAKRRNVSDANNNEGASGSGADLPEEVAAKMSILMNAPKYQRACERALKELGIKMEDWN
ncbi:uncharacterized protein LOC117181659 isoform X3 [Belonocnema kinseyi]|uniref:uncharacterized protein LOC117181659 isoform X1 n=1 Tax=Belonocnema kinseyi TaxID=2817044 RepID=UPI00143DC81E|nr:uncharacterized protein LOC117181659 isoform X1 [Belonocnema kinseyi]XP_033230459.1 uncharacterized protein LOC117181659 isoform X2 [Belonocnema kinseyi]XP_033230467.1 uncharacterized protein LOC117181659 isoform X3 [Belonocnema kinseyi]